MNNLINSVVQCYLKTSAPSLSQRLAEVSQKVSVDYNVTDSKRVVASTKVFEAKGTPIGALKARIEKLRADIKNPELGRMPNLVSPGYVYVMREDIGDVQQLFDDTVADLVGLKADVRKAWPALIAESTYANGNLTDHIKWPTVEDFLDGPKGFNIDLIWLSQPQPLPPGVMTGLAKEIKASVAAAAAASQKHAEDMLRTSHYGPVRDLLVTVTKLVSSYSQPRERVRQEPFDGLKDAATQLSKLNWLKIPEITDLCSALDDAGSVNIVTATADERKAAIDKVRAVKEQMEVSVRSLADDLGI